MFLPKTHIYTIEHIYALPDGTRAELIDGQIYDMAPAKHSASGYQHGLVYPSKQLYICHPRKMQGFRRPLCCFSE